MDGIEKNPHIENILQGLSALSKDNQDLKRSLEDSQQEAKRYKQKFEGSKEELKIVKENLKKKEESVLKWQNMFMNITRYCLCVQRLIFSKVR
jgi:hypothetical protein